LNVTDRDIAVCVTVSQTTSRQPQQTTNHLSPSIPAEHTLTGT
jgi:hypothetical protein